MFPLRARDVPCAVLAGGLSLFVLPSLCRFAVVWDVRFGYFEACTKSRVPKYPSLSSISGFPLGEGMPRLEDAPQCNGPPIFARRASLLVFFFFLPRLCRPASTPFLSFLSYFILRRRKQFEDQGLRLRYVKRECVGKSKNQGRRSQQIRISARVLLFGASSDNAPFTMFLRRCVVL